MSFVQVEFLWFFTAFFAIYWIARARRIQNALLLVASVIFYGWVHPWFVALLAFSAVLDFYVGLGLVRAPDHRKALLAVSMVGNLGMLAVFKYLDFFIENFAAALGALGWSTSIHTLGIFLPVGISFYTFQTMSYTIDVYRGKVEPRTSFLDYATFVSMFPQLVAGPVERARSLLPQVEADRTWSWERFRSGFGLALWGAVKKVVVADTMALYADRVFVMQTPSFLLVAGGTLLFAVQILADFSGYTDMARGTARMLGFELMENFRHPYLAATPSQFWQRWHISFSTWIHEYVYIPLGGSRHGPGRRVAATYGALLLSGLWHGASWNFVVWGAYHATLLTGYRLVQARLPLALLQSRALRPLAVALMFGFTCLGWLLFRERDFGRLATYAGLVSDPLGGWMAHQVLGAVVWTVALMGGGALVAALVVDRIVLARLRPTAAWPVVETSLWAAAAVVLFLFARDSVNDFIYFQF